MGSFSIWHWLVVLLVVLLLFGSGKISGLMGDLATGIKSFKKNMREDEDASMADGTHTPPAGNLPPPGTPGAPTTGTGNATTTANPSRPAA
ncbi:twin-arginine translocase TatA/TatE family subunit [Roseomonas sp. OT10]|uniref:twin-arginine translocase TatA/TatE family subunit n=1 Tax=Roseomonas cutis TaxID=2897332 RepID=UPI001E57849A|nr:twin-arginine translocase TatA/TatE family subunit [Roseomonas sp. OT10]UFN49950.1 twin-arginine translocase TatA/TatE family subunit [Roseomonas sp. OT10]